MAKAFSGKKPQHFGNTIRVFLNYLGRHKFMLGLVGVLTAVSALANLLGTYMIKPVVNGILETGSIPGLVRGVALTAAIYAVGALSTLGYTQTMVRAAQKVLHDIRRDLFAHLQTLPLSFFDSRRNGELMSLFTNDVDTISDALNNSFALLIQSFIQVVGTLVLLFVLNWRLSLLVRGGVRRHVLVHPVQHQPQPFLLRPPAAGSWRSGRLCGGDGRRAKGGQGVQP